MENRDTLCLPLNASKTYTVGNQHAEMGEDVAAAGEILITQEAMQMIPSDAGIQSREISISISGVNIPSYVIQYELE